MKLTILLLFLTLSIPVCAQFHNVKGVRIVERTAAGDSTTISGVGQIQYDGDDDKFRFNDGVSWYSYIKEGATLPYWPVSTGVNLSGSYLISGASDFTIIGSGNFANHDGFDFFATVDLRGTTNLFLEGGSSLDYINIDNNGVDINGSLQITEFGVELPFVPEVLDTAVYVLVREHSSGEVKRRSVSSIASSGAFMPLTGTADLTGNTVIDGNNHDLTFGSTNRLDDFIVDADNSVILDVDAGSSEATMTLNSGLYSVSMSDDGGSTADVQILVQSGAADILRIIKDESLVVIEIEADGDILMPNLPTDCTGRDAGTLWNDSNTVKLCP